MNNCFKVLRPGSNTTFQDEGFFNVQHLGITTSGIIDNKLFFLANKIVGNNVKTPALEFAFQGPKLKLIKGNCRFVITGNVAFNIIKKSNKINGVCNHSYLIKEGEIIDILSTINSNYGYFAIEGGFIINNEFGSFSTLTLSKIGANNGNKLIEDQKVYFKNNGSGIVSKSEIQFNEKTNFIRVVRGLQMNFFMLKVINNFYNKSFIISKNINRMGVRLKGNKIYAIKSSNIASEGIIKGSVQVPGNGDPIVLLNDHPTIGGYPKIATVILADLSKLAQLPIGSRFNFKEVTLKEAVIIYNKHMLNIKSKLTKIN